MIIVKNNILPFKGYKAITLWPFIFTRDKLTDIDINHEKIHGALLLELLVIGFYIIYGIEWLFKKYRNISFEKEAYTNLDNLEYLKTRKWYAQWRK